MLRAYQEVHSHLEASDPVSISSLNVHVNLLNIGLNKISKKKDEFMANEVLEAIRNRRSVLRFESTQVEEDKVEAILEAGRWAPSWINKQPWNFIVIRDQKTKDELSEVVPTTFVQGLKEAPVCIAVTVDADEDPYHHVEDGATATQNMALAAHSLGLNTSWIGVYDLRNQKKSAEFKVKEILEVPKNHRVIALLSLGYVKYGVPKKDRKALRQIVYQEKFGKR
jgi:nitroreductase